MKLIGNIVRNVTDMKIKKLMPMDAESRRLIDWMEKGIPRTLSALFSIPLVQWLIHSGISFLHRCL